jgi:hypothetical protein
VVDGGALKPGSCGVGLSAFEFVCGTPTAARSAGGGLKGT